MAADSELVTRLRQFLRTADLTTTTTTTVRRQLENEFSVDLSCRKEFIREQIRLCLSNDVVEEENDAVEGEIGEEEGEEELENAEEELEVEGGIEEDEVEENEEKLDNKKKDIKKRSGGFCKPCALSPKLQEFAGEAELARTEVVKKIWAYIHEKDLQNPSNKRKIMCDEKLYALFQVKSIDMFKMNKALSKHIWPIEDYAISVKSSEKESQGKRRKEEGLDDHPKLKAKRKKGGASGFLTPLPLSDALVKFIGTGENALSRSDVVRRLWQYIKDNNLQDPSDKRKIICDDKLKELFKVDTFIGFTGSKLLTAHFIKEE